MRLRLLAGPICLAAALLAPVGGWAQARQQMPAAVQDWVSAVVTKIAEADRNRVDRARDKARGTVTIRVEVAADGFLNRAEIAGGSGSDALDQRARSAARAASPFSPPPPTLLTKAGTTTLSFPLSLGR